MKPPRSSLALARALVGALLLAASTSTLALNIPRDVVTLLYRKETPQAPNRLDPAIQAVSLALERELSNRNYRIPQTPPDVLRLMDKGSAVIVSFAPDAGLSMIYSVYRDMRPLPGADVAIAEIRIEARVFVGSGLLSAERGRGQVQTRTEASVREYGERRAYEVAAEKAAADLVDRVHARLKSLTADQIASLAELPGYEGGGQVVDPPAPAAPAVPAVPAPAPTSPASPPVVVIPPAQPPSAPAPSPTRPQPEIVIPPATASTAPEANSPLPPPARRYAVVVGISDYSPARRLGMGGEDLPGTQIDVGNITRAFERLGFASQDVTILRNSAATAANVKGAIEKIARQAGPEDLVVFYVSGHGMQADLKPKGVSMPVLYDYRSQSGDAPDYRELLDAMASSSAQRLLMIADTCHSGGASSILPVIEVSSRGLRASKASGAPQADRVAQAIAAGKNIAVLTAAKYEEFSWEAGDGGGLFTKAFSEALQGPAGKAPLKQLMETQVGRTVIEQSRQICSSQPPGQCPTGQQTPTLGYNGRGHMIRM